MPQLKKINVFSAAKAFGLVSGGLYLAVVLVIMILGALFAGEEAGAKYNLLNFTSSLLATILFALLIAAINFVIGACLTWVYNLTTKLTGGIKIELDEKSIAAKADDSEFIADDEEPIKPSAAPVKKDSAIGGSKAQAEVNELIKDFSPLDDSQDRDQTY